MTTRKWGESFLKSGLPLEHFALMSLTSIGWTCEPHWEYRRINREGTKATFEIDLIAYSPGEGPELMLLAERKCHDEARFWFFLPCETEDHLAQREALSAGSNLKADSKLLHSAPYEMVADSDSEQLIGLAPLGVWGVTVSRNGSRKRPGGSRAAGQATCAARDREGR